ncbi:hypothetical protein MD535_22295 [Vibrio sp. ZSDZ65]|uniref:Uncharacterized protein n=1 Tax=Vibrio qingdaonensis TaxID=2829491 RepID=A0A9X3CSN8_9VIBR|nr:hypothetical protein [Vibrio qingdaonensis]MCW8348723.1 hypothetical protein [Vibrio qingdaonensis]
MPTIANQRGALSLSMAYWLSFTMLGLLAALSLGRHLYHVHIAQTIDNTITQVIGDVNSQFYEQAMRHRCFFQGAQTGNATHEFGHYRYDYAGGLARYFTVTFTFDDADYAQDIGPYLSADRQNGLDYQWDVPLLYLHPDTQTVNTTASVVDCHI